MTHPFLENVISSTILNETLLSTFYISKYLKRFLVLFSCLTYTPRYIFSLPFPLIGIFLYVIQLFPVKLEATRHVIILSTNEKTRLRIILK